MSGQQPACLMRLLHYTKKPFVLRDCSYLQGETASPGKPNGLWVSVEGDMDWPEWCATDRPEWIRDYYITEIALKPDANVLRIETVLQLDAFHKHYAEVPEYRKHWPKDIQSKDIDWGRVSAVHAGIIIAPYQWERRLHCETNWYYGWDCASGCIWDLSVIESCKEVGRYAI